MTVPVRVRVVAHHSVFRGRSGVVVRSSPPGAVDPAHSVVLDEGSADDVRALPPMTFYPHEVSFIETIKEDGR